LNKHVKRLRDSKAARNSLASYVSFVSTTVTGLISVPLAVHFLSKEELGLWAVITAISGYLNFMEMGLGFATGRKMADAIVAKDKAEIDRWWTLTRVVLAIQGVIVVVLGLALTPLFMSQMAADFGNRQQAMHLFIAMVVMLGVNFPFRGAESVLTAQERFHWIPLRQALIFWVELGVLASCLFAGLGLYGVLWGKVATLVVVWVLNWVLLRQSEPKLGWNRSGLRWDRFRSLFGFSLNISAVGIMDVIVKSLPIMMLGKIGGLAAVPVYTFTIKISNVLMALGKRNYQSFYPALQRMFVQKEHAMLRRKFSSVGMITVATGLGIAALILAMNRTAVELLAKPDFYAGTMATSWFAVAAITNPLSGFFQMPLLVAGKMGKSALVAFLRLSLGICLYLLAYRQFGLVGLAAVVALLPLVTTVYACWRGAKECGFGVREIAGPTLLWAGGSIVAITSGGWLISVMPPSTWMVTVLRKPVTMPGWSEAMVALPLAIAAVTLFARAARSFRKPVMDSPLAPVHNVG